MNLLCSQLDPYESIVQRTLDKLIPINVDWEITYNCNLKCSHCYQTGPTQQKELTTEKIKSVIDELAQIGSLYITFTGGEILTRPDFFEIANYARKREFALRLFTNGILVDEDISKRIADLNPLSVEVSLYAMNPEIHDGFTRLPGSFDQTIRAIDLLKKQNLNVIIKCTLMKENIAEFDALKDYAQKIQSKFTYAFTVIPKIDGSRDVLKHRLSEDELNGFFKKHDWIIEGEGGVSTYKPLCAAGMNSLYISPYGDVYPCVILQESCGNLKTQKLKDIWQAKYLKDLRAIQFEDLKKCKACKVSGFCDRCAGLALIEDNDLLGISPNDCILANVRAKAFRSKEKKNEGREGKEVLPKT